MKKAPSTSAVLLALLSSLLLVTASSVFLAQSRAHTGRRIVPVKYRPSLSKSPARSTGKPQYVPRTLPAVPLAITQRAAPHRSAGSRVAGDENIPRQTVLLTTRDALGGASNNPAPSQDAHPFYSPDEAFIYFDSDRGDATTTPQVATGTFNIFRMGANGGGVTQITSGAGNKIEPATDSSGSLLAYVGGGTINYSSLDAPATSGFNLFVYNQTSGVTTPYTQPNQNNINFADVRHPSFAPNGSQVVFAGRVQGQTQYHLYVINIGTGAITQYTTGPSYDYAPAWSPDGRVIAFTSNATAFTTADNILAASGVGGNDNIWVISTNSNSFAPTRVTIPTTPDGGQFVANSKNPAWSGLRPDALGYVPISNPTNNGTTNLLLGFASNRGTFVNNVGTAAAPRFDIFYLRVTIAPDATPGRQGAPTVTTPESQNNLAIHLRTSTPGANISTSTVTGDQNTYEASYSFDPANTGSDEDYPAFPQFNNTYRIVFQSNKSLNGDASLNIYGSNVIDLNAPQLLRYSTSTLDVVGVYPAGSSNPTNNPAVPGQRQFDPGTQVVFKVRVADYESGVSRSPNTSSGVFLQIKDPNSAPQSADNTEHKTFYDGTTTTGLQGQLDANDRVQFVPIELDSQAVNANNSNAEFRQRGTDPTNSAYAGSVLRNSPPWNPYIAGLDDVNALSGAEHPADWDDGKGTVDQNSGPGTLGLKGYWLAMYDDGPISQGGHEPEGEKAGDGVWTGVWTTPSLFGSDWIVDVIAYDEATDPFTESAGAALGHNWKIYDNVWGLTTQRFQPNTLNNSILYVGDYDTGQRFFNSVSGLSTQGQLPGVGGSGEFNTRFNGYPTESWMTEIDPALVPTFAVNTTGTINLVNVRQTLGASSYQDGLTNDGTNIPATGRYDIWRILCRGPITDADLRPYQGQLVNQPPIIGTTTPNQATVAERMVFWHSPYTGTLFVGPGTLDDIQTQQTLTNYVANGGRLCVDGQNIGFGITSNQPDPAGSSNFPFLRDVLHVGYQGDYQTGVPPAIYNITYPAGVKGANPINTETWYIGGGIQPLHDYLPIQPGPINTPPSAQSPMWFGPNPPGHPEMWNCPNQSNTDTMQFLAPTNGFPEDFSVEGVFSGGNEYGTAFKDAIWRITNRAPATGTTPGRVLSKVVGMTIGMEGIDPEFDITNNVANIHNVRAEIMHNVSDYLRTGRVVGTVRSTNGNAAGAGIPNGYVQAVELRDPLPAPRNRVIVATARTDKEGNYVLNGLEATGPYEINFVRAGYNPASGSVNVQPQTRQATYFHGGWQSRLDLFSKPAGNGLIRGRVTVRSTGAPVAGAVVQAIDESTVNANVTAVNVPPTDTTSRPFFQATSDAQGNYSISVPGGGVYAIRIINLDPTGSGAPGTLPYGGSVPPDYGLTTTTGTLGLVTVNDTQTVTGKDFLLTPIPGRISGTVTQGGSRTVPVTDPTYNPNAGNPIAGATVTATIGQATYTATTAANGTYTITGIDPGTVSVVATAVGFSPSAAQSVTVQSNTLTPNVNFVLLPIPPGSITGEVLTSGATGPQVPIAGATVSVVDANGNVLTNPKTNVKLTTTTGTVQGQDAGYFQFINAVPAGGTVIVQATKTGYRTPANGTDPGGQAVAKVTITITSGQTTANVQLFLDPLQTFSNLLSLVSAPYEYTTSVATLLGITNTSAFSFVAWNAASQSYVTYPTPPADTFHLGRGYFIQNTDVNSSLTLNTEGATAPETAGNYQPFPIALSSGWNLIGDPYTYPVTYSQLQVQAGGVTYSVAQAQSRGIIGAALWTYVGGTYQLAYSIDPYHGYWVKALQSGVTLVFTSEARLNKGVRRNQMTTIQERSRLVALGTVGNPIVSEDQRGWKLDLLAEADGHNAAPGTIGMHPQATNDYDNYKMSEPPVVDPNHNVTLTFDHETWGRMSGKYSVDVRSAATSAQSWEFTVGSNMAGKAVTLRWPSMATLPRRTTLKLTDLTTGQTFDLRTRQTVTIAAAKDGVTRRYRIDASRTEKANLILSEVTARYIPAGAGRAVSDGSLAIGYHITSDATVTVSLKTTGGRVFSTPQPTRSRAAGSTEFSVPMRDGNGHPIPTGLYNVEVLATDSEGHQVRQIMPLQILR